MFGPIFVAVLLTAPTPQPSATPALKTIASVRASARCAEIITHANSAIGTTLNNDAVVGKTIGTLRLLNLDDGNPINRRKGFTALGELAKTLMQQARAGDDEVKRLRRIAAKTKDSTQAKDLKDFADELGGALWRQQTIARDLNGYLAYEDFKDMTQWSDADKQMNHALFGVDDPQAQLPTDAQMSRRGVVPMPPMHPMLGHDANEPTATEYAKAAAQDFQNRIPDIILDENHAATHIDGALGGCNGQ
jgi:hypothetical protein